MALAPETDSVKHVDAGDEPAKDSHKVEFEGMGTLMGEPSPYFRVFLGKLASLEKAAPFWHVKPTDADEDVNMVLTKIAVAVRVSAEMRGEFSNQRAGKMLEHYVSPEVEVKVILPLFVNSRDIEKGEKLYFHEIRAENKQEERKAPEEIDAISAWKKQRTAFAQETGNSKKQPSRHKKR